MASFAKMAQETAKYYEKAFKDAEFKALFSKMLCPRRAPCLAQTKQKFLELRQIFRSLTKVFAKVSKSVLEKIVTITDLRVSAADFRRQTLGLVLAMMAEFVSESKAPDRRAKKPHSKLWASG